MCFLDKIPSFSIMQNSLKSVKFLPDVLNHGGVDERFISCGSVVLSALKWMYEWSVSNFVIGRPSAGYTTVQTVPPSGSTFFYFWYPIPALVGRPALPCGCGSISVSIKYRVALLNTLYGHFTTSIFLWFRVFMAVSPVPFCFYGIFPRFSTFKKC